MVFECEGETSTLQTWSCCIVSDVEPYALAVLAVAVLFEGPRPG